MLRIGLRAWYPDASSQVRVTPRLFHSFVPTHSVRLQIRTTVTNSHTGIARHAMGAGPISRIIHMLLRQGHVARHSHVSFRRYAIFRRVITGLLFTLSIIRLTMDIFRGVRITLSLSTMVRVSHVVRIRVSPTARISTWVRILVDRNVTPPSGRFQDVITCVLFIILHFLYDQSRLTILIVRRRATLIVRPYRLPRVREASYQANFRANYVTQDSQDRRAVAIVVKIIALRHRSLSNVVTRIRTKEPDGIFYAGGITASFRLPAFAFRAASVLRLTTLHVE